MNEILCPGCREELTYSCKKCPSCQCIVEHLTVALPEEGQICPEKNRGDVVGAMNQANQGGEAVASLSGRQVEIVKVDIAHSSLPFGAMVGLIFKWTMASVPTVLFLFIVGFILNLVIP